MNFLLVIALILQLLQSEPILGSHHSYKGIKHSNTLKGISFFRQHRNSLSDDSIDYDDNYEQFKQFSHLKKNRRHPYVLSSRHIPDIRARNQDLKINLLKNSLDDENTALSHPKGYQFPPDVIKCFKCDTHPSEVQCGSDGKTYENTCYRECAQMYPSLAPYKVDLLFMGPCPTCNCSQIWNAECAELGSADITCLNFCNRWIRAYEITCGGNKKTNGACICAAKPGVIEHFGHSFCGTDGNIYYDVCRRDCAGADKAPLSYCLCNCDLVWKVECGYELGFKVNFSKECLEKCKKEKKAWEKTRYMGCKNKRRCYCDFKYGDIKYCGSDHVLYPNACVLSKCLGMMPVSKDECPKCNCLASLWSKECGATDHLPIIPECQDECPTSRRLLAKRNRQVVCTKISKKACVCDSKKNPKKQCGTDGNTYDSDCHRKCEAEIPLAYDGECVG